MRADYNINMSQTHMYTDSNRQYIYIFKLHVAITDTAQLQVAGDDFGR